MAQGHIFLSHLPGRRAIVPVQHGRAVTRQARQPGHGWPCANRIARGEDVNEEEDKGTRRGVGKRRMGAPPVMNGTGSPPGGSSGREERRERSSSADPF
jgi:hypothetical protein